MEEFQINSNVEMMFQFQKSNPIAFYSNLLSVFDFDDELSELLFYCIAFSDGDKKNLEDILNTKLKFF
tara:strand:+ start:1110 stop:1313 length:204 start_codon:yes stop_codon:yes gene_type:complete